MNDYNLTGKKITEYLKKNQMLDGSIYDEIDEKKTPDNHYAHTHFALAAMHLYAKTKDPNWLKACENALRYYFSISERKRGHRELNNLAILSIFLKFKKHLKGPILEKIDEYISIMKFDSDLDKNLSNNWIAMKAVCHAMNFRISRGVEEKEKAELLIDYVLKCQLEDGFFYDWPNDLSSKTYVTPLTYHAAICSMLLFYYEFIENSNALKASVKGLDSLKHFIADDGETFYYGRSNNALFGCVSGICAYEKAAQLSPEKSSEFRYCGAKLFEFIRRWQQEDGHINIAPNNLEREKCGWDEYMHSTVYNAHAAALLLSGFENERHVPVINKMTYHAKNSGLFTIRNDNFFLSLSTKGQAAPHGTMFSDPRYYGMNVLCMKYSGLDIVPPSPLFKTSLRDTLNPGLTGFLPFIITDNKVYSPRVYDSVRVDEGESVTSIFAKGQITAYEPRRIYELVNGHNTLYHLYRECLDRREIAYTIERLPNALYYRAIVVLPHEPLLLFINHADLPGKKSIITNSLSGRFTSENIEVANRRVKHKGRAIDTVIECISSDKLEDIEIISAPTSKGMCSVVNNNLTLNQKREFSSIYALYLDSHTGEIPKLKGKIIDSYSSNIQIKTEKGKYDLTVDLMRMSNEISNDFF